MIANTDIERARAVPIEDEVARRGIQLKRAGAEQFGPCPVCGGDDRFAINVNKQVFNCRVCGAKGDVIELVRHLDGVSFKDALTTLTGDGVRIRTTPPPKPTKRHDDEDDKASKATWLWSQRKPITEGTPPWLYLRKRGYTGPIPATLAYLPPRGSYPAAMIAAFGVAAEIDEPGIISAPQQVIGVHLTRLTAEGDKAQNADGKAKIMRGVCKGAPITISPPNDLLGMAVTEGIEDALSVYQTTGLGVWAAGSAGFMPALAPLIPDYIETVTIYAHDDDPGRSKAIDLARALNARGIDIFIEGLLP
jgi:putative DNA primase/helicase